MTDLYTSKQIQAILENAGRTIVMMHVRGVWPAGYQGFWPEIVRDRVESYGYNAPETVRYRPNMRQLSEFEKVESWIIDLSSYCKKRNMPYVARTVVYGMLHRPEDGTRIWSWRKLGRKFGRSHTTIKNWYDDGVEIILRQRNEKLIKSRAYKINNF